MSEAEEPVAVVDRRGQATETPPPPPPKRRPIGEPMRFHCDHCGEDVSRYVLAANLMLPAPGPGGTVTFAPQALLLRPAACPLCGEPQLYQSQIAVAGTPPPR